MKFLGGLVLGIILSLVYFQTRPVSLPPDTKTQFKLFGEKEAKKFAEANDGPSKLKAAEELYGKMMVLFLANLGIQLQKSQSVDLSMPDSSVQTPVVADVATAVKDSSCAPCGQTEKTPEKKEFTKKLTTPEKFKSTVYLNKMESRLRNILGVFAGKLSHFAGSRKGKIDTALIEINLRERGEVLDGEINVILTDEAGTPYSRNRGKGGNKTIRFNEKDRMVYVEASPNSFFSFNLSQFSRNELRGEYYEDNAMVGRALFYRQ